VASWHKNILLERAGRLIIDATLMHLVLILGLVLAVLLFEDGTIDHRLHVAVWAGIWAHILASLYNGGFDRLRTSTYMLLVLFMLATQLFSFATFLFPWGQLVFFLASVLPQSFSGWLAPVFDGQASSPLIWPVILFSLLVIDLLVMQRKMGGITRIMGIGLVILIFAATIFISCNLNAADLPPSDQLVDLIPHWSLLPGFSILRAVPSKEMGVAALFAACALPLLVPWLPSERVRVVSATWLRLIYCLALLAIVFVLGYLGTLPPEDGAILQAQIATALFFLLFPGVPLLLNVLPKRDSDMKGCK
jgi:quinol-cytochrome oxidoreductase complex cytochrome b subunit